MPNGWKKNARRDAVLGAGVLGVGAVGLGRKKAARGGSSKQFAGNWRGDAKIGAGGIHSLTRGGKKSRLGTLAQKERCVVAVALNERYVRGRACVCVVRHDVRRRRLSR